MTERIIDEEIPHGPISIGLRSRKSEVVPSISTVKRFDTLDGNTEGEIS